VGGEPFAQDARYHEQQDEVRRDRAESDVEGPKWRQEGDKRVDDMHPLGQDLGHDVDNEECQRTEGERTVHGLSHHPVSRRQDGPVSSQKADDDGTGEADEREYPCVEQHETLGSGIDVTAGLGHDQHEYDNDDRRDRGHRDLLQVVRSRSPRPRMRTLTSA
jgi:hypothetical protein